AGSAQTAISSSAIVQGRAEIIGVSLSAARKKRNPAAAGSSPGRAPLFCPEFPMASAARLAEFLGGGDERRLIALFNRSKLRSSALEALRSLLEVVRLLENGGQGARFRARAFGVLGEAVPRHLAQRGDVIGIALRNVRI